MGEKPTSDVTNLLLSIREKLPKDHSLLSRQFIEVEKAQENGCISEQKNLVTIMQWNILAQALCTGADNFIKCPEEALSWDFRKYRILEELLEVYPDVICMEEVDHYDFFEKVLNDLGYCGAWKPKPDSPALYVPESNGPDGCAMFYKNDKFELIIQKSQVLQSNNVDCNQVCIMSKFKLKESNAIFNVGVTHLKAKSGFNELRYTQGLDLLKKLKDFAQDEALLICGDFNAPPSEEVVCAFKESDLNLQSSYELCPELPQYTTWKIRGGEKETEVCRIIDYIWYRREKVALKHILSIPTEQDIGPSRLPCFTYPSDHVSLAVKIQIV